MKKIAIFSLFLAGFVVCADAAPVSGNQRRGAAATETPAAAASSTTSARAATTRTTAARSGTAPASAVSSARSAAPAVRTTAARSGTVPTTVSARAAATQKVVNTGTKIATASVNTVVNEECQKKYYGCMDSFCMLDNTSGGRCLCSSRNAELDTVLAEIEALDAQSYKMATEGVERLEMGADAEAAMASANAIANSMKTENTTAAKRRTLDLSLWDSVDFDFDEDIFSTEQKSPLEGKVGDNLHKAASELCVSQMAECGKDIAMLQMMYSQQIKSDCTAYENDLKKQKTASQNKLSAAEKALRETALEQLRTANKWDLGQCTIQFKNCMATTAGCKDDFTGCVGIHAAENARTTSGKAAVKMYDIKGSATKISIAASTYDTLDSKKPMCMNVTNSCVAVRDQVWDTFLREVGPQIKTAELLAESDLRMNCIANISDCFQKACKDTIDPNDPEGSYDLCLTRPESVKSLCRVQIDPCVAAEPLILDFVYARLASMRVDSCTSQVKECLQSEDRCGADYTQCVGLDTDTIVRMCPYDKLVGCQQVYSEGANKKDIRGDAVYEELANMVQGIMLNIDNNMLTLCQNAANEAMVKVCGGTEECNGLAIDEGIGSRSLEYKFCEYDMTGNVFGLNFNKCRTSLDQITDDELAGPLLDYTTGARGPSTSIAAAITGTIYWDTIDNDSEELMNADEYIAEIETLTGQKFSEGEKQNIRQKVNTEVRSLQQSINNAISAIESDPTVQFCMTGREVQGMKVKDVRQNMNGKEAARFPELTKQMRQIIRTYAIKAAKENYYVKYDELTKKMMEDYAQVGTRLADIRKEDTLNTRREMARQACVSFAELSALPRSPNPPGNAFGKILKGVVIAGAIVAAPIAGPALGAGIATLASGGAGFAVGTAAATASLVGGGVLAAGAGAAMIGAVSGGSGGANGGQLDPTKLDLVGSKELNQWNYKEVITSTFEWETLNCHKCVRAQNCTSKKNPLFGKKYCKSWADPVETCTDTQF